MKGVLKAMGFAAVTLLAVSFGNASESASLRAEVADAGAKAASLQHGCNDCGSCGSCEQEGGELVSMKGNAKIQIGGALYMDLLVTDRDSTTGDVQSTVFDIPVDDFYTAESRLDFRINTKDENSYVFIALDLSEWDGGTAGDNDDLIDQAYFAWEDINCSNWGIVFGKADTHYGWDKYPGIMAGIQDGGLYNADGQLDGVGGSAATQIALPTGPLSVYMIGVSYGFDWGTFYFDLFQNNTAYDNGGNSQDSLFFESWAAALEINPSESLTLKASFLVQHDETLVNGGTTPPAAIAGNAATGEEDQKALSLAIDWTHCDWNVWAEYQHGWDWAHENGVDVDLFTLGVMYTIDERWSVYALGEVGQIDGLSASNVVSANTTATEEEYTQFQIGAVRTLDSGITLTFEYARQEVETDTTAGTVEQDGDSIGIRAGIVF